uniref:Centrosomin N-terminal motif 1 domain-containing protein n=1 Tax=Electrophorus electricus TaxID=8005 RepID=A0A4W4DN43_ELEEL
MDSVVGEDQTLPFDINGSCSISRLPDSLTGHDFSMDNVAVSMFPGQKMSPAKAITMKDYENQITALKKENFNLKLRIYFLEERVQRNCDDSTEDIYKTNIELKVEVESMKRELAEKQDLLVSASKALESLASRDSGEGVRERALRERAQREMDSLRDAFNARISELEESLRSAEAEVEKMASIAEQEKLRSLGLEKGLQAAAQSQPSCGPGSVPGQVRELQQAVLEKDGAIECLQASIKNQEALIGELRKKCPEQPVTEQLTQLSALIGQKDRELQALKDELDDERGKAEKNNQACSLKQDELNRLQQMTRQLSEDLSSAKNSSQTLLHRLEERDRENTALSSELEQKEGDLAVEKKNALKRDKTIQGLSLLLKEKEKEIEELYGNLEEKQQTLTKTREALHKAQLQKYQGAEEQQALLLAQQAELARLQAEAHASLLEAQRLRRSVDSKEAELAVLRQDKQQLEQELDALQQQKRTGDKTINDLQNQLKKLNGELADRENALEHQRHKQQEENRTTEHKLHSTIQHLTTSLTHKEQQLQDYMNMVRDLEQDRAPGGSDITLTKLRERLGEKEKALEKALDEKFVAVEEKENEVHMLQLSMREKERELERLNNLLTHNEETINLFDSLLKEKDVELQQLVNTVKNLQRSRQESEASLQRALREKDAIIQQLQHSLQLKATDMEELASTVLSQTESQGRDLAERMGQRLKVTEALLSEAVKDRDRLVSENQTAVENLLATINSKDQLLKERVESHTRALSDRAAELQDLRRQLSEARKPNGTATQDASLGTAQLRAALAEKDAVMNKLLVQGQERDGHLAEVKVSESLPPQVLELRQTIEVLQERLEKREAELSRPNSGENMVRSPVDSKKSTVLLKKELAEKTDALDSALKRENQLKMSLAELQPVVSELEGQLEGQTANMEFLTSTLNTKEEIIAELQACLTKRGERQPSAARNWHSQPGEESSFSTLPQRERTIIGGDSQQAVPSLGDLCLEQAELNRVLRAEQQLYANLVRAVKEQDSAQQLQALQLELATVTLLRQQLEDGIRDNEGLRERLHREIQRANQREGADPAELESMRDTLEEVQRWNASLQARLGEIQNRGGGVGQANDSVGTLSLIGEQTSYMSICVGAELGVELEAELQQMPVEQLRLKVSELQAVNAELERRLALAEKGIVGNAQSESKGEPDLTDLSSASKQPHGPAGPLTTDAPGTRAVPDAKEEVDAEAQSQAAEGGGGAPHTTDHQGGESEQAGDVQGSVSQLRAQVSKLRAEASELHGLLKEDCATESKESAESSGESDSQTDLRQVVRVLRAEARGHRKVIRLLKEQLHREAAGGGVTSDPDPIVSMAREMERLRAEHEASQRHAHSPEEEEEEGRGQSFRLTKSQKFQMVRHATCARSRLPVPVRPARRSSRQELSDRDTEESSECRSGTDSERAGPSRKVGAASDAPESELRSQLELLNQECQDKEELISRLQAQVQEWEGLRAELQETDRLNGQYAEALRAAESTIAYLTACSLDAESGLGRSGPGLDSWWRRERAELQEAAQEKARPDAAPLTGPAPGPSEPRDSGGGLDGLLAQVEALQDPDRTRAPRAQDADDDVPVEGQNGPLPRLAECVLAAGRAVESVANFAAGPGHGVGDGEASANQELQRHLDRLHRALLEMDGLGDLGAADTSQNGVAGTLWPESVPRVPGAAQQKTSTPIPHGHRDQAGLASPQQQSEADAPAPGRGRTPHLDLHKNLVLLLQVLGERAQKVRELEEELKREEGRGHGGGAVVEAEDGSHLKRLQKALKEQQEACRPLEEKLVSAQQSAAKREQRPDLHTDVDGTARPDRAPSPVLTRAGFSSADNLDTGESSPCYPSSPDLSSPRPTDPADLCQELQQLKSQVEGQNMVIQHLQRRLRKKSLSAESLTVTSDPEGGEEEEDRQAMKARIAQLAIEPERGRMVNSSSQSASPSRVESLVQAQARELCELREQIRASRVLGVGQRRQLQELRATLEELLEQPERPALDASLRQQLDRSLDLLEKLEYGGSNEDQVAELELVQRLSAELRDKNKLIQHLRERLRSGAPRMHSVSDSEMSNRISNDGAASLQDSLPALHTHPSIRTTTGMKAAAGGVSGSGGGSVRAVQRENSRLQGQLRSSDELNATLRSELDLMCSILAHTRAQSPAAAVQQEQQCLPQQQAGNKSISSALLAEHLLEARALRQRLEESIRTNDRLREQLETKLQVAESDPDKQKENDSLRDTLTRRTAKLEMSRKECHALRQEHAHLQDKLYRLQCDSKLQKQQLADTQQLLQTVQVELQVHEQIRNSTHTVTGEGHLGAEPGTVDLTELLSEVRRLRLQLERSIQTNTALRHKLEQQLLSRADGPSTININYLLATTDEGVKSERLPQHSRSSSPAHDSGSSVGSGSPSRSVPGDGLWASGRGRHMLGLVEDYRALSKQIRRAKRLSTFMDTQLQEGRGLVDCKDGSGTILLVLEEAERLLNLFWRVTLPSGDLTHRQQEDVFRSEISCLRSRLSQQERMLTGAVKRLRSTNQLREGMERIIIDQLSLTHGVLKRARGNLEFNYGSIFGLEGFRVEGNHPECPVRSQSPDPAPRRLSTPPSDRWQKAGIQ